MRKQVEKGVDGTRVNLVGEGHNHPPVGSQWSHFPPHKPEEQKHGAGVPYPKPRHETHEVS